MSYSVKWEGESASFSRDDDFIRAASAAGDVLFILGRPGPAAGAVSGHVAVAVELGTQCLEFHEGDGADNLVGFARWRLGRNAPTQLVELVRGRRTGDAAIQAVRTVLEAAGFVVAISADRAGRIVDRLIRPQFNLALQAVDDDLATAPDLELCLTLGLGYRRGLLSQVVEGGLDHHHDVTSALFDVYGQPHYAPARSAVEAKRRAIDART